MSPNAKESSDLQDRSDEQLLTDYRQGRHEAFAELIERYKQELFNLLLRMVGNRAAAEDIFQDTFLQVHLSADTFDIERRFKPWLFTIAANKARDHLRRRSRRTAAQLDAPISDDGQSFVDLLEAEIPMPSDDIEQQELSERVQKTVSEMPEHLREILLLAYFQKLAYNDIAEMLKVPLGTVKSRLHTAVATFAKLWRRANSAEDAA